MKKLKILKHALPEPEPAPIAQKSLSLRIRHALERQGFRVYAVNDGAIEGKKRQVKGVSFFIAVKYGSRVLFIKENDGAEGKNFIRGVDNCLSYGTVCKADDFEGFENWIQRKK